MSQEQIANAKQELQLKMDKIVSSGAGCTVIDDNGELVTQISLASFEVLRAIPFFDRKTGEILRFDFWVFILEYYFDQGMQYAHLIRMNKVEWIHEDYVVMVNTDGWSYHISKFEPIKIDPKPHEQLEKWKWYYKDNGLEEAATSLRSEYYSMMEAQL